MFTKPISAVLFTPSRFYAGLRHPRERRSLWVTLAVVGTAMLLVGVFSLGTALLLALFALWAVGVLTHLNRSRHLGNALRVGANQFPKLAEQIAQAARRVRVPPVQVFVYQEDKINAYAFGWAPPHSIAMTSGTVVSLEEDELRFVVGHEMGHIALGHTRLTTLIGGLLGAPAIPIVSAGLLLIFQHWSRYAEYSADRAGLVACGDLDRAIRTLVKLLVGARLAEQVDVGAVIAQSRELDRRLDALGEAGAMHPYLVHRVRALVEFWATPTCQSLLRATAAMEA